MSNEDQTGMKPKNKGAGTIVSNFIDEHNGFLTLSDELHMLKLSHIHPMKILFWIVSTK
jgi:hypothetical protein